MLLHGGSGLGGGLQPTPPSSRGLSIDRRDAWGRIMSGIGPRLSIPPLLLIDIIIAITAIIDRFYSYKRSIISISGILNPPL